MNTMAASIGNKKSETAAPWPRLPPVSPIWYASVANRCVVLTGPPRVRTWTILKSEKVKIVENSTTTARTGLSSGSVTWRKRPQDGAPDQPLELEVPEQEHRQPDTEHRLEDDGDEGEDERVVDGLPKDLVAENVSEVLQPDELPG